MDYMIIFAVYHLFCSFVPTQVLRETDVISMRKWLETVTS